MKNTVLISSFLGRGQRWQLVALVALFFAAGCTVELYPPAQEVSNLPDGGNVDVLPDTIPRAFSFGPRMYWSQIVGSDSTYSFAVTGANKTGRWLDSIRWVPSGPFVTVNGDTLSTRAYARDNSGLAGDNQVLTYNGSGSLSIEDGNTVDMSDLLDNTDEQTIDTLTLQGDTMLQVSLSGDGAPVKELDLSALRSVVDSTRLTQDSILVYYQDGAEVGRDTIAGTGGGGSGTDDQTLTYNGSGSLTIEDGNTVDMSDLLDNTDDQAIDTFSLSSTTLSLSLESDGEAAQTVDLSSLTTNEPITLSGDVTGSGTTVITTTIATGAVGADELASTAVTPGAYTNANVTIDADGRITAAASGSGGGVIDSTRLEQDSILVYYQDGAEVGRDTIAGVGGGTGGGSADNLGNHIMTQNLQANGNWISGDGGNEGIYVESDGDVITSNVITGNLGHKYSAGGEHMLRCDGIVASARLNSGKIIEITLPTAFFSSGAGGYNIQFEVTVATMTSSNRMFVKMATATPPGSAYEFGVYGMDGKNLSGYEWRIGNDGTNTKLWIGTLTKGFYGFVSINNVVLFTKTFGPEVSDLCDGFVVSEENVGYDVVLQSGTISPLYHNLVRRGAGPFYDQTTVSGAVYSAAWSGGNAAEITIAPTSAMTGGLISMDIIFKNGNAQNENGRSGTLTAKVNFATKAWSYAKFYWHSGGLYNPDFVIRLGDDGTNMKMWFGELSNSVGFPSSIAIKNISLNSYGSYFGTQQLELLLGATWSFSTEGTSFDNVDQTIYAGLSAQSIPYATSEWFGYDSNFVYSNSKLGLGTSTPSYILDINSTDAVRLPAGTTAQRPTGANGLLRLSSTSNKLEAYYDAQWNTIASEEIEDDGSASDTTDGSGDITVSHTLGSASITVTATATGTTFYHVQVHSKTSTTFKIRFYNSLGSAATSTAVTADWIAKLQ